MKSYHKQISYSSERKVTDNTSVTSRDLILLIEASQTKDIVISLLDKNAVQASKVLRIYNNGNFKVSINLLGNIQDISQGAELFFNKDKDIFLNRSLVSSENNLSVLSI